MESCIIQVSVNSGGCINERGGIKKKLTEFVWVYLSYDKRTRDQPTWYDGGYGHRVLFIHFRNDSVLVTLC